MDLNFAFLIFCLTVIVLVAISKEQIKLAEKAVEALTSTINAIMRFDKSNEQAE
jgi:hypothetical protein